MRKYLLLFFFIFYLVNINIYSAEKIVDIIPKFSFDKLLFYPLDANNKADYGYYSLKKKMLDLEPEEDFLENPYYEKIDDDVINELGNSYNKFYLCNFFTIAAGTLSALSITSGGICFILNSTINSSASLSLLSFFQNGYLFAGSITFFLGGILLVLFCVMLPYAIFFYKNYLNNKNEVIYFLNENNQTGNNNSINFCLNYKL